LEEDGNLAIEITDRTMMFYTSLIDWTGVFMHSAHSRRKCPVLLSWPHTWPHFSPLIRFCCQGSAQFFLECGSSLQL